MLTDRMGIDIWEVVRLLALKQYGFMRFEPGPGMGGALFTRRSVLFELACREFDMTTEFVELAGKVNRRMP